MSNPYEKKNKYGMTRAQEIQASKLFGKYVSKEKAIVLFIVTSIACFMPCLNGLRLWDSIPEIVETGLIGASGEDDSLPRAVLVFGIPGLMTVLNIICHAQLWLNQKSEKLAPQASRIVGRWGFPILSVIFASGCIIKGAGQSLDALFIVPCAAALLLMLYSSHVFDDASKNLRIPSVFWMVASLFILFMLMYFGTLPLWSAVVLVALLVLPFAAVKIKSE